LQWGGPEHEKLFAEVRKDGRVHPAELRRPRLRDDCLRYYDAYRMLGAARVWNQIGPEAIRVSEVESYLNLCGIEDPHTKLKYLRLIQRMDRVELKVIHARTANK